MASSNAELWLADGVGADRRGSGGLMSVLPVSRSTADGGATSGVDGGIVDGGEKRCAGCGTWRERAAFTRDRSRGDGYTARCKACRALRVDGALQQGDLTALVERDADRATDVPRLIWTIECVLCGGYEQVVSGGWLPVYCWRDRARLLLSQERVSGEEARPSVWG